MIIELSSEDGPIFLEFEVFGPLTTGYLTEIVSQLDNDDTIQKISIEIATESPATLELPALTQNTIPGRRSDGDEIELAAGTPPNQQSDTKEERQSANPTTASEDNTPRLQPGSGPFVVMRVVAHHDGWLRTQEIADSIPTEWMCLRTHSDPTFGAWKAAAWSKSGPMMRINDRNSTELLIAANEF